MKVESICVFVLVIGFASCGLIPAPYNSAFVRTSQVGGNFAYSTVAGLGYQAYSPFSQHVAQPLAYPYANHPLHFGYPHPHPVSYYTPSVVAAPAYFGNPHFGSNQFLPTNPVFANPAASPVEPSEVASDNNTETSLDTTTDEQSNSDNDEDSVSVEAA